MLDMMPQLVYSQALTYYMVCYELYKVYIV